MTFAGRLEIALFLAVLTALTPLVGGYGLGGVVAPFVGIKLIDLVVHNLLGA